MSGYPLHSKQLEDVPGKVIRQKGHTDACPRRCSHWFGVRYQWADKVGDKATPKVETGLANETEAFERLREVERTKREMKRGGVPAHIREQSAYEYIKGYMGTRDDWSPNTQTKYRQALERHVRGTFETFPITDFLPWRMREFWEAMKTSGVSSSDMGIVKGFISAAAEVAVTDRLIDVNPCGGLRTPRRVRAVQPREVPTMDQARAILGVASPWLRDVLTVAAGTGLRQGEILAIDAECLTDENTLTIRRQWYDGDRWQNHLKSKREGETRSIPLSPEVYEILRRRCDVGHGGLAFPRAEHLRKRGYKEKRYSGEPIPVRRDFLDEEIRVTNKLAQGPHFTIHSWRHFFATNLFAQGIPVEEVSRYLGHEKIQTTLDTYIHFIKPVTDRAVAAISGLLGELAA